MTSAKFDADGRQMIEVPTGGGGGTGSTGVAIIAGTQTATSGSVSLVNSNGISFGMSNSSRITASYTVPTQSVQTQNCVDVTLAGNSTSAAGGFILISSGTMTLAGGNNIVLSQAGNAVTISASNGGAAISAGTQSGNTGTIVFANSNGVTFGMSGNSQITASVAGASAGIASIANSQTTYTSGLVSLSGANAVTIRSSAGQVFQFDVPFQSVETASYLLDGTSNSIVGLSTSSAVNVNSIKFRPVGGISVGFDLNDVIELSVGTGGGGGGSESIGMSGGNTSGTAGLVSADGFKYVFAGGNNVTLSQSLDGAHKSGTLTISGVSFANSNGMTLSANAGTVTGSYTVPVVGNAIQAVGTATDSGTNTSKFAADDHVHVGVYSMGVHTSGNTAGNTGVRPGQFILAGSNAITLSQETAALSLQTVWFQGPASATTISGVTSANVIGTRGSRFALEDHQHVGVYSAGVSTGGNTTGDTAVRPGQLVLAGGNNITLSGGTAAGSLQTITISGVSFQNSNGLTLSASAGTVTGSYTVPSTAGLLSAIKISGGGTSSNVSSVNFSDANAFSWFYDGTNMQGNWGFAVSAGTTSRNNLTGITFSNANNISWGLFPGINNTSKISASYELDVSAGTTSSGVNSLSFVDSNGIFWGLNGGSITAEQGYLSYYENQPWLVATQTQANGNSTEVLVPFILPQPGSFSYVRMPITMSSNSTTQTATTNSSFGFTASVLSTHYAVVYSLGTGANSRSLQYVASGSGGFSEQISLSVSSGVNGSGTRWSVQIKVTYPSEGASNSTASGSTAQSSGVLGVNTDSILSQFNGFRYLDIPFANSLSAGAYWLAFGQSTSTQLQAAGLSFVTGGHVDYSNIGATQPNVAFGIMGQASSSSNMLQLGLGSYTTNAMTTSSIALSQISSTASHIHPYFQMIRQA